MNPILKHLLLWNSGVVRKGLVLWLDGKDFTNSPSTTSWLDRSGLGNNATPSGFAYTTASGSDGVGGVTFDGVDDYVSIPTMLGLNVGTGDFSILFQMKLTQIGIFEDLFGGSTVVLYMSIDNALKYNNVLGESTSGTLNVNTQYYVSVVRQSGIVKMKINVIDVDSPYSDAESYNFSTITIGKANSYTKGTIRSFLLYNRALTDTEILQNYNASRR